LIGKDVLNTRSDYRLSCVGALDMPKHRFEIWLFAMKLRNKALLFHEVFIAL